MMTIRSYLRVFIFTATVAALLTACAGAIQVDQTPTSLPVTAQPDPQGSGSTITPIPQITLTQEVTMPSPSPSPEAFDDNPLVRQAKGDLAQRLDVPVEDIELIQFEAVVWPDASLGCPRPGMVYAQVLSPGYLVVLKADGKEYEYHAGKGGEVFYCENPAPPVPGAPGVI